MHNLYTVKRNTLNLIGIPKGITLDCFRPLNYISLLKNPNPRLLYKKTVTALLAKEKKLTKQLKEAVGNSVQCYRLGLNSKLRLLLAL